MFIRMFFPTDDQHNLAYVAYDMLYDVEHCSDPVRRQRSIESAKQDTKYIVQIRNVLADRSYTLEEKVTYMVYNHYCDFEEEPKWNGKLIQEWYEEMWSPYFDEPLPLPEADRLPLSPIGQLRSKLGRERVELQRAMGVFYGYPLQNQIALYQPPLEPLDPEKYDDESYLVAQLELTEQEFLRARVLLKAPPQDYPEPFDHYMAVMAPSDPTPGEWDSVFWYLYRLLTIPEECRERGVSTNVFPDFIRFWINTERYWKLPGVDFIANIPAEMGWHQLLAMYPPLFREWLAKNNYLEGYPISLAEYWDRVKSTPPEWSKPYRLQQPMDPDDARAQSWREWDEEQARTKRT